MLAFEVNSGYENRDRREMRYIVDTNVWIDVVRGKILFNDLADRPQVSVVLAPPVLMELVRGMIKGGGESFEKQKGLFRCMVDSRLEILELPRVHVMHALWNTSLGDSGVRPDHYKKLMQMIVESPQLVDFIAATEKPHSVWKKMNQFDAIHEGVLEKELGALETLARQASVRAISRNVARMYGLGGLIPDPEVLERKFSAGIEFIKSGMTRIRHGANPRKNDRGTYVDAQLFWYLSDAEAVIVTNEDFLNEIKFSPQVSRIMSYETFSRLETPVDVRTLN